MKFVIVILLLSVRTVWEWPYNWLKHVAKYLYNIIIFMEYIPMYFDRCKQ
jgi:hypothetical protein